MTAKEAREITESKEVALAGYHHVIEMIKKAAGRGSYFIIVQCLITESGQEMLRNDGYEVGNRQEGTGLTKISWDK